MKKKISLDFFLLLLFHKRISSIVSPKLYFKLPTLGLVEQKGKNKSHQMEKSAYSHSKSTTTALHTAFWMYFRVY